MKKAVLAFMVVGLIALFMTNPTFPDHQEALGVNQEEVADLEYFNLFLCSTVRSQARGNMLSLGIFDKVVIVDNMR